MDLKINGQLILLHGKCELDLYLDQPGEQLPDEAVIRIHGGPLKLHGRPEGPGLTIVCDEPMQIFERHHHPGIAIKKSGQGPSITRYWPGDASQSPV